MNRRGHKGCAEVAELEEFMLDKSEGGMNRREHKGCAEVAELEEFMLDKS